VFPDTSPRNHGIEGISSDYSWGESAGYYVNATAEKYKTNFNMFSYVNEELPRVVAQHFPVSLEKRAVTGFSMGGHGALISGLKTGKWKSVSAFSPITNPSQSAWGKKAFEEFFGAVEAGKEYDSTEIVASGKFHKVPLLIEVGTSDKHLDKLKVKEFADKAAAAGLKLIFKERELYDHSFWYVASFLHEHFEFHSHFLHSWE
jgi:S-formylglutathione hydrolase